MDKKYILIGMVIALLAGGGTYLIDEALDKDYDLYECYAKEPAVAMLCWKLSAINDEGTQTRCYWNMSASTRYKQCSTGWLLSDKIEIEGEETTLPDVEIYKVKTDFNTKAEAEEYITTLKSEISYIVNIVDATQEPYSNELEIYWNVNILKGEDIIYSGLVTSNINEDATKQEIVELVNKHAEDWFSRWKPNIIIDRSDKLQEVN